jgi:hypothetical protein
MALKAFFGVDVLVQRDGMDHGGGTDRQQPEQDDAGASVDAGLAAARKRARL